MIYKNLNNKLNDDFDFNKVKNHNIQDDYTFSSFITRTRINSNIDLNDILNTQYSLDISKFAKQGYYDIIGQCYYNKIKDRISYRSIMPEDFRMTYKNIFKIINNLEDDFNMLLVSIICWWHNIKSIDELKKILISDEKAHYTDYIGYWESEDHGIIMVEEIDMAVALPDYRDKKYFIVCYTGKVDYSKEYKLNEDFDFGKIKGNNVQDEYEIDLGIVRKYLTKDCNICDIIDPELFQMLNGNNHINDVQTYHNIGSCFGIIKNKFFAFNDKQIIPADDRNGWFGVLEDKLRDLGFTEYNDDCDGAIYEVKYGDMFNKMLDILSDGKASQNLPNSWSNITWWESPDKGYILVEDLYYEYEDKKLNGCNDYMTGVFICYTGLVDYRLLNKHSINEDFDFGKIKSERIEDNYTFPRQAIRKINSAININDICISLWNYSIRPLLRPKSGRMHLPGGEVIQSINSTFLVRPESLAYTKTILPNDVTEMEKDAGFTPQRFTFNEYFGIDTINDTPDYMRDLIAVILRMDMTNIIDVKYWLSPDEGIVIIDYIKYTLPGYKIRVTSPIIAYTGLVEYSIENTNTDKINDVNAQEKLISDGQAFINRLLKHVTKAKNQYREYNILTNKDHLIMSFKQDTVLIANRSYPSIENLFFEYRTNSNGDLVLNSIIPFYTYEKSIDPMSIIILKYDKETNNVIAGYMSSNKNICLYYVTDYNVLVKLIGEENAKLTKKCGFIIRGCKVWYNVYPFWYVTDKGMELFKKYQNGEISLRNI